MQANKIYLAVLGLVFLNRGPLQPLRGSTDSARLRNVGLRAS